MIGDKHQGVYITTLGKVLLVLGTLLFGGFVWLPWMMFGIYSPDLTPAVAASTIAARPEFNRTREVVEVTYLYRCGDSLDNICYFGDFTFKERGSGVPVRADLQFSYWENGWHLDHFWYGEPPNVETVRISSDLPLRR